jgi:general secretion pathway protein L
MNYLIIQLSAEETIFSRFRETGKKLVFVEATRYTNDGAPPFTSLLQEMKAAVQTEERIILAIPPSRLFMREMEFSLADRRKVREILPLEMKGETAVDTEEVVFDCLSLEGGKFLAIWGKQQQIAEEIRMMTEQGMEPEIVSSSLFHWQAMLPDRENSAPVALTDGEALAVYADGFPVFFRPLDRTEFLPEISRTIAALEISRGITVDRVYLHGRAARQSAQSTADGLSPGTVFSPLPVRGDFAATFPADPEAALDLAGSYAIASGCRGKDPVNFRRGDLAYTAGFALARKKFRLTLYLAAAMLMLLFAEAGLRYYLVSRDLNSLNTSIKGIYREIFPTRKKPVDEVAELRSEIKRLSGSSAGSSILPVLKRLAELKGDDVAGIYEAEIEGGQVRLKGDARSIQGVNEFKTRASAQFTGSDLGEIKSRPDGSVSFVFKATMKEGEK